MVKVNKVDKYSKVLIENKFVLKIKIKRLSVILEMKHTLNIKIFYTKYYTIYKWKALYSALNDQNFFLKFCLGISMAPSKLKILQMEILCKRWWVFSWWIESQAMWTSCLTRREFLIKRESWFNLSTYHDANIYNGWKIRRPSWPGTRGNLRITKEPASYHVG